MEIERLKALIRFKQRQKREGEGEGEGDEPGRDEVTPNTVLHAGICIMGSHHNNFDFGNVQPFLNLSQELLDYADSNGNSDINPKVVATLRTKYGVLLELHKAGSLSEIAAILRRDCPVPNRRLWSAESLKASIYMDKTVRNVAKAAMFKFVVPQSLPTRYLLEQQIKLSADECAANEAQGFTRLFNTIAPELKRAAERGTKHYRIRMAAIVHVHSMVMAMSARGLKWSDLCSQNMARIKLARDTMLAIDAADTWDKVVAAITAAAPKPWKRHNIDSLNALCDKAMVRAALDKMWNLEYLQWIEPRES